ncbi:MAG: hybrid sensor histidine kinase/response regulator [Hyphomicrobiales bacterium]
MSIQWDEIKSSDDDDPASLEKRLDKLAKINAVLMDRVERSMDQQGNAFSLFQTAIGLEAKVRARTEELTTVLHRLERSNDALVVAKDEAERANLSKTRFLAAASHDLLQPLNAARLSISVLSAMQTANDARTLASQIDQSLQTIEDLIKTLLDISKLDAGVVKPDVKDFPLDDVLSLLKASFQPQAAAKGLKLKVRRCGLMVRSDPMLLLRVLQNLVSNAVRYTDKGGVLVGVRKRGEHCLIDVVDTGRGISESERETIFEEFYRGAAAAGGSHTGLGLGLSIVQRTVLTLSHSLFVTSELGKGSTFRLRVQGAGVAPKVDRVAPERRAIADTATGAHVLLIENDPDVASAMVRLLDGWSCHTVTARSPEEIGPALDQMERRPDIVLADYHLDQGKTGLAALEEFHRRAGSEIPAVVITADRGAAIAAEVEAAGCELMHKPVRPAELRALMTHLLGQGTAS